MNVTELFSDDQQKRIADAIEEILITGKPTIEAELLTADWEYIPHEFAGARLTDPDGTVIGLVGAGHNMT
ncbi:MAG: putative signal-transducing histidine kinase [Haloquadratum walsbyi J07HQW1]|jgi:PAS fold.|uniref:Putative signal-transducing histidine kinase n=1 Tax=Haloquadratum walsbyi J07HQW1 TaxID=1238424 RepID=U1PGW5_9EURY|nr:MAG: putative signal-transducing histidine kinase [Haloquadratum walsbyi J07HQW1]